jgi:hypothetical protein
VHAIASGFVSRLACVIPATDIASATSNQHQASSIQQQASKIQHQATVSSIKHPKSSIKHQAQIKH